MVSYHRGIRLAQMDKKNINFGGSILQFLWHLFITSKILAIYRLYIFYSKLLIE
jgi:hypothetical protein